MEIALHWMVRLETTEHQPTGMEIALNWMARLETTEHQPTGMEIALHLMARLEWRLLYTGWLDWGGDCSTLAG